jgi:methanol metabolism-related c-type cytochrome
MAARYFRGRVLAATLLLTLAATFSVGIRPAAPEDAEKPYSIAPDGTVDWYTYNGFRRYHADCHVCHGPDGLGSSFGPALVDSLKKLSREEFMDIVVNGRKNVSASSDKVMPSFGLNQNVMCFTDDIYAYLKARSDGVLGRSRPPKYAEKPEEAKQRDDSCLGTPG